MGVLSIGLSAKLVMRYGLPAPLGDGLGLAGLGLLWLRALRRRSYLRRHLPEHGAARLGAGMAFNLCFSPR
jgi:hypothetical protein